MAAYLDNISKLEDAIKWLEAETGETWTLGRLLDDACVMPFLWLDYAPDAPAEIFGDRIEGYLAPMLFGGDIGRLSADKTTVIMTMTKTHDGTFFRMKPGLSFPISELRFKREDLLREAAKVGAGETVSEAKQVDPVDDANWKTQARAIAKEYLERHVEQDLFPSQEDVCKHLETVLRERKIFGAHKKPLDTSYIQRNAIQGEWWKENSKR